MRPPLRRLPPALHERDFALLLAAVLANSFGTQMVAVAALDSPVLYVVSRDEGLTEDAQALYDATAADVKQLKILPGSAHGSELLDPILNRSGYKAARALVESFLRSR